MMRVSTSATRAVATAVLLALPTSARADSAAVGLFLATGDKAAVTADLRQGAELAAEECTGACRLVAARDGGQWTAGAGELVRLVYTEGVGAVLGAADGRTAHLAEQVVARAKGRFVLLSPWATDPTLTQIKVPWFFRLAPDDRQQAEAVLEEIGATHSRTLTVVVAGFDFDSRAAADAFEKAARVRGAPQLDKILVGTEGADLDRLVAEVRAARAEAVFFLEPPDAAAQAVRRLREAGITAAFFGPLRLASSAFFDAAGDAAEGMVLAAPPDRSGPEAERFRARYRETHHREPSPAAAYGYDGARLLIDALRSTNGAGGDPLRAALAAGRRDGVTGAIAFDTAGNRAGPAPLARVEGGRLRPIRRDEHRPAISATDHAAIR